MILYIDKYLKYKNKYFNYKLQIGKGLLYNDIELLYDKLILENEKQNKINIQNEINKIINTSTITEQINAINNAKDKKNIGIFKILLLYSSVVDNNNLLFIIENPNSILTQKGFILELLKKGYSINTIDKYILKLNEDFIENSIKRGLDINLLLSFERFKNFNKDFLFKTISIINFNKQYIKILLQLDFSLYDILIYNYDNIKTNKINIILIKELIEETFYLLLIEALNKAKNENNYNIVKLLMMYSVFYDKQMFKENLIYLKDNLNDIFLDKLFIIELIKKDYDIDYINDNIFIIDDYFIESSLKNNISPLYFVKFKKLTLDMKEKLKNLIHENNLSKLNVNDLELPEIILEDEYSERYKKQLSDMLKNRIMKIDNRLTIYVTKITEYKYKLKQYLNKNNCIKNRIKQLEGGCWLNTVLNNFILNEYLKNRITELINYFITNKIITLESISVKFEEKNKIEYIEDDFELNEFKIVKSIIHILYQIICKDGIRDISKKIENKCIINLAYLIKYYSNPIDLKNEIINKNSSFSTYDTFLLIINLFNEIIIKTNLNINKNFLLEKNNINFNKNTLNHLHLVLDISLNKKVSIQNIAISSFIDNEWLYLNLSKININFDNDFVLNLEETLQYSKDKEINSIYTLNEYKYIDFLTVTIANGKIIPNKIILNGIIFELSSVGLKVAWNKTELSKNVINSGHAITGFKCKNDFYIYDSHDKFFKANITNITEENIKNVYNYYRLFMMNQKQEDKLINDVSIFYSYAIYNNTMKKNSSLEICI